MAIDSAAQLIAVVAEIRYRLLLKLLLQRDEIVKVDAIGNSAERGKFVIYKEVLHQYKSWLNHLHTTATKLILNKVTIKLQSLVSITRPF